MRQLLMLWTVLLAMSVPVSGADRPNIVWLVSEDNSVHYMKLYTDHGAATPHIAAMAQHGLIYQHAFSNAPVCSVARTTLATGCYGPRIGTQYHRRSVAVPLPDQMKMFPEYLRQAGYYTANNNKTDYNAIPGKGVWDDSSRKASWRNRSEGQAFFYMQSFPVSHESSLHFTAEQMAKETTTTSPNDVFVAPYHPDTATFRYTYARYLDRIMDMDRQIGAVVDELTKDGLLEETFIFYFGDHGGVLPRGKGYAYESGLHVPLVVRIPDKWKHLVDATPGSRVNGFVSFIDFGPTVLNLAGVAVPEQMDGRPFLGQGVVGSEVEKRDEAFGYADRFDEKYDLVRTLRKGRFEYVRSFQPFNFDGLQNNYRYRMLAYQEWRKLYQDGQLNDVQKQFFEARPAEQLFDIEADPYETTNLANDPAYAETLQKMRTALTDRLKAMPDLSFYPESFLVEQAFKNPVAFGQQHREEIARLIDIANMQLLPPDDAVAQLKPILSGLNRWEIYWALIDCTAFGKDAESLSGLAEHLADQNLHGLLKVRAAEFLATIGKRDPQPALIDAIRHASSDIEAGLMLNSAVFLKDGPTKSEISISGQDLPSGFSKNDTVARRLEYLNPGPSRRR
ncbi:MAG: sulfatase [Planctomycetaceae bacterium]|nr:sulfatase [Planctomycetaceae bacterium]